MTMPFGGARSPRRRVKETNLLIFLSGTFLGFLLSSFLSMAQDDGNPTASNIPEHSLLAQTADGASLASGQRKMTSDPHEQNEDPWALIHVFRGNSSHMVEASSISKDFFGTARWFSQLRQDMVVSTLLHGKTDGYFVDLAANDAVRISNTYALETFYGWNGLCIEPNPIYWAGLSYRACEVVGAVAGRQSMEEVNFKFPNRAPPKGGIVGASFDNKEPSQFGEDQRRYTVSLGEIFDRFDTPSVIDYLSLDVEGAETFVMESFPFDRYRFNVLTIERPDESFSLLLRSKGYILLKQLKKWGETLWVHNSVQSSLNLAALDIETENYVYRETA